MIGQTLKIAGRTAVLVAAAVAAGLLLTVVSIPGISMTPVVSYINKAYTIFCHWIPIFPVLWGVGVALFDLYLIEITFKIGVWGYHFILKAME